MEKYSVNINDKKFKIEFKKTDNISDINEVLLNGKKISVNLDIENFSSIVIDNNTHKVNGIYEYDGELVKLLIGKDYHDVSVEEVRPIQNKNSISAKKETIVKAPMPGKIISIDIKKDDKVKKGDKLLILEAMKMENTIKSPCNGIVKDIKYKANDTCNADDVLIIFE